jgi:hypothetical protein
MADPNTALSFAQAIYGFFKGQKQGGQSDAAIKAQLELARRQMEMQQQQFAEDLPFRQDLFSALKGRQQQQFPRFLPQSRPVSNPYQNVRKGTIPSRPAQPSITSALKNSAAPGQRQTMAR